MDQINKLWHILDSPSTPELTMPGVQDETGYYYIDSSKKYEKSKPYLMQNLISLYGLTAISNSVARLNDDGTKGVKLRKSYKAHISDLPGKHSAIPKDRTISPIAFAPPREGAPTVIKQFEPTMLGYNLSFQKTPDSGIPGFDAVNLAIGDSSSQSSKRKQKKSPDDGDDVKRRRVE